VVRGEEDGDVRGWRGDLFAGGRKKRRVMRKRVSAGVGGG